MSEVQVKSEPVDTGYEEAVSSNIDQPVDGQRYRSLLKGLLEKFDQGQSITHVIEDLLQKNEALIAQNDPIPFKPNPRTIYKKDDFRPKGSKDGNFVRPKSPTRTCEIPQKDMSHIGQTLMEMGVYEKSTETSFESMTHEMVCGVASKAFVLTQEGVNIQTDMQFYWCNFCPFKTEYKKSLLQHVMEHRFHCKFCTYQSFSRADVIRHASKEHADFKSTAESLRYCTFLPDFLQLQVNSKKRKIEEENEPVTKKAKTYKPGPKSKKDEKSKVAMADTMFEMEVDEVDEDDNENESSEEEHESVDKVISPSKKDIQATTKPVPVPKTPVIPKTPIVTASPGASTILSVAPKPTIPTPTQKNHPGKTNTVTVSSGLCWNCGYCDFVTLSQTFLKTHLNTQHGGKAHKYVAMLVSSQDEMNKIKERDNQMYLSPNPALLLGSPTVSSSTSAAEVEKTVASHSKAEDNGEDVMDSDSDEEYIPAEEKKKYPLTYKCAHCNFNAPVCFKIKEHLLFKHAGCVLYALDMRAVKLKQKRYVFFCHRQNCSFTTKKTEEYLNHSESCTPWLEPGCPEKIETAAKKCLELTRNFSTKISQKAFQMARNFKTSKTAEYACVHCSYTSNNNTRVKKHVLANHKDSDTVMRDLQASKMKKKTTVYFCKICLWETRVDGDLGEHLKEKHNEDAPRPMASSSDATPVPKSPSSPEKSPLMPKIVSVTSGKAAMTTPTSSVSGSDEDDIEDDDDSEPEHQEPDDGFEGLEIPDEDIQRMMDDYITDEASRGKSSGRPNRAAAAKASARVQAQGHSPTLYKCLHCQHLNFGETLMKRHMATVHPKVALRALDVKKRSQKSNPYICFCPKDLCKYVHSNEENVANHAEQNHAINRDSAEIKAILQPFVPASSPEKHIISGGKSFAQYECLFCKTSVQRNTTLKMRQHILAEHPEKEMIFRDCVARKARRACRVFMCADITCVFFTTDQKEIALHKLAHDNTRIYECSECQWFTTTLDTVGGHMAALHQGKQVSTIEICLELDDEGNVVRKVGGTVIKQEPE
jgi:hypothetical protein